MPSLTLTAGWLYRLAGLVLNSDETTGNLTARLFVNDVVPAFGDQVDKYQECDAPFYAPITLDGTEWDEVLIGTRLACTYLETTFLVGPADEPFTVFGLFITDPAGNLMGAGRLTAPVPVNLSAVRVVVTPELDFGPC